MTAHDVTHHPTVADERNQIDQDRTRLLVVAGFSLNAPATLKYCFMLIASATAAVAMLPQFFLDQLAYFCANHRLQVLK